MALYYSLFLSRCQVEERTTNARGRRFRSLTDWCPVRSIILPLAFFRQCAFRHRTTVELYLRYNRLLILYVRRSQLRPCGRSALEKNIYYKNNTWTDGWLQRSFGNWLVCPMRPPAKMPTLVYHSSCDYGRTDRAHGARVNYYCSYFVPLLRTTTTIILLILYTTNNVVVLYITGNLWSMNAIDWRPMFLFDENEAT